MVVRCGVKGCDKNARVPRTHTFFHLPRQPELRAQWLLFAGVLEPTANFRICIDHFDSKYIGKRHPRCLLAPKSIPTIKPMESRATNDEPASTENTAPQRSGSSEGNFRVHEFHCENVPSKTLDGPTATYGEQAQGVQREEVESSPPKLEATVTPSIMTRSNFSSSNEQLTPKSLRITTQRRTILALRSKITRIKRNINLQPNRPTKISEVKAAKLIAASSPYLTKEARILFQSQLRLAKLGKFGKRYSDEMKDIGLSIMYHSPKTYRFMQKFLHLPSTRTLRTYQAKCPVYPDFNTSILAALTDKFEGSTQADKLVSLLFDEIILTPEVHFDPPSDKFFGFANDGSLRQPHVAKSALVVMISLLKKSLKQVVGYFLLASAGNSDLTHQLILQSIDKVSEHGLIVKTVIFDQGPRNQGFLSNVRITPEKPYFYRNNTKIFVMYDPPHLVKSIRNNLQKQEFKYKDGVASWAEIEKVFELSRENPLNLRGG